MKNKYLLLPVLALLLGAPRAQAQNPESQVLKTYASPSVQGMGKSRGIIIGYERLPQFDIDSKSEDPRVGDGSGHVRRNNKFDVRAFGPVINKPQTKLILGLTYKYEEFEFGNITPSSYSLYENLQDKHLKSLGLQLAFLHSLNDRRFYLIRVKGELNGDYRQENIGISDFLKTTVDLAYGWKKTPDYAIGVGVEVGYTFGRQSIYPGILYNRTFNKQWGVESIFPANARVRYNMDEKTLFYAGYKIEGAAYTLRVKNPPLSEFGNVELRRTDFKGLVRAEREIYDFLWFAVEGGFRQYYRNRVFDDIGSQNELIKNDLAGTGYIGVELFAVPPRKLLKKHGGE
ncbi:DUF6268 family outer membrane beta-barrel protein [Pontibacter liquoris]|uniref:DUF6268 family outer membrane beta-barrel protein n=1 Tax=Pontibacter liquoris TaxID=2905677 RepID=UPI001FA77A0E|nr:DUF6268 family outer membrane beta-barrel protein [Pontibacter liquoris]